MTCPSGWANTQICNSAPANTWQYRTPNFRVDLHNPTSKDPGGRTSPFVLASKDPFSHTKEDVRTGKFCIPVFPETCCLLSRRSPSSAPAKQKITSKCNLLNFNVDCSLGLEMCVCYDCNMPLDWIFKLTKIGADWGNGGPWHGWQCEHMECCNGQKSIGITCRMFLELRMMLQSAT